MSSIQSFLNDANNIEQLMPEDKITKWQSDNNTCSFNIKGLAGIGMKREESSIANQVHFVSHGKNKLGITFFPAHIAVGGIRMRSRFSLQPWRKNQSFG